ncbi:PREDICTED: F-box/FBD/LRR-repeat protein At5g44980 [Camelina sativa]|uniref:F-box/FBD/LRR-repeat protein At5g44980 n=1 Tax=Camelina sativa TaxID=90675 RepID=A0ABM0UT02_CAMSA|nr:PREDICTED: F-box/FBD/LRR-repeat protein At5g44980 [Camelina sativa]
MEFDRISALPDSLLAHILSYLSISVSAKTSVLSKRWEFLWLKVFVLDLTTVKVSLRREAMSRVMRVKEITFLDFSQEKKKVRYHDSKDSNNGVMDLIAEVIHRRVQHLEANMCDIMPQGAINFMPKYVYVSKTLVSLNLANVGLENPKFVASLPKLKMMHLQHIYYENKGGLLIIKKLVSASPLLEVITFDFSDLMKPDKETEIRLEFFRKPERKYFVVPWKQKQIDFRKNLSDDLTNVPQCLISTLEYVKIKEKSGIKLVNYILENSAVLKKLTLSFTHPSVTNQELESYKKLLTSTKLSPTCQLVFD